MPVKDVLHPFSYRRYNDFQSRLFTFPDQVLVTESVGAQKDLAIDAHQRPAGKFRVNERPEIGT